IWFDPNANYAVEIGPNEIIEDGGPPTPIGVSSGLRTGMNGREAEGHTWPSRRLKRLRLTSPI
ncbi:hypothetical protein PMAYCL1PPCAC_20868, partial [Pristionchus mayeri]